MKLLIASAAALALTGSAYAYQTAPATDVDMNATTTALTPGLQVSVDPNVAITPPANWSPEQRALYEEHLDFHPTTWTEQQRAQFQAMRSVPPVSWTPEQRALYQEHIVALPDSWTPQQRASYEQQIAGFRTPWVGTAQTASTYDTTATSTYAMAPASGPLAQPDNSNPERDARGIRVISDPAVVPSGFNGIAGTAMGGPLNDPATGEAQGADTSYPACTATVTDNCIQLYERGVRGALAEWNRSGGYDAEARTAVGGPDEAATMSGSTTATTTTRWGTTSPTGTTPNDPVDTQGSGLIDESPTGIHADQTDEHDH